MQKALEIYFLFSMAIFAVVMISFVGFLVIKGIMGIPANYILNYSLLMALIGGFVPLITNSIKKSL
jgi:hypothetical protein